MGKKERKNILPFLFVISLFIVLLFVNCENPFLPNVLEAKTVTFESNGGTSVPNQVLIRDQRVERPRNPARDMHDFNGWYQDDVSFLKQWNFETEIPAKDITLYAKWTPWPVYKISLSYSGDLHFGSAQDSNYEEKTPLVVTVTNTGNQPTGAISINLSETNPGSFTLSETSIDNIKPGESSNFTVALSMGLGVNVYSATVTVSAGNILESFNISFHVGIVLVDNAEITVTKPATDDVPVNSASGDEGYTINTVSWMPNHNPFQRNTEYTVTLTLAVKDGYKFTNQTTAAINQNSANITVAKDELTAVVEYKFPATLKSPGSEVGKPAAIASSPDSITVESVFPLTPTGQIVEYNISSSDNGEYYLKTEWQTDTLFKELFDDTDYYVYARSKENSDYTAGKPNVSDRIRFYIITFDLGNGTGTTPQKQAVLEEYPILSLPGGTGFSNGVYFFGGWADEEEKIYSADGSHYIYKNITLYAKWKTVSVDSAGQAASLFDTLESALKSIVTGGTYTIKITENQTISYVINAASSVNITLLGQTPSSVITIKVPDTGGNVFRINNRVTLTLDNVTLEGNSDNSLSVIQVNTGGTLIMRNNSVITGNTVPGGNGGAVFINSGGTFDMNGGEITNNNAVNGGGVFVRDGTFNMYGNATINDNEANNGGGVFVQDGTFNMYGSAAINGNEANNGGGVFVQNGTFKMSGGTIHGNNAASRGGGVIVAFTGNFIKKPPEGESESGTIYGITGDAGGSPNIAGVNGNAVFVHTLIRRQTTVRPAETLSYIDFEEDGNWIDQ